VLFIIKDTSLLNIRGKKTAEQAGLTYSSATIGELVSKDTDKDGIPDWEEVLYGLDPTKKETMPGIQDSVALIKLQAAQENTGTANGKILGPENLTQTDKFSRELFSTIVATTENGSLDQATADQISSSLADRIQNPAPRKVFTLSDIKIIKDNSAQAVKNYNNALNIIYSKYPINGNVLTILTKFLGDGTNVDVSALAELTPIIEQGKNRITALIKTSAPQDFASAELDLINVGERLMENLSDMQLYDTDPIVALGAVSQYNDNVTALGASASNLTNLVKQKLNN
jgi:hypothetical protein